MASQEPVDFKIPTIDLSAYLQDPASADADAVVEEIRKACATSGFFQLVGHGVSQSLQSQAFAAAKVLFDLPDEEKRKLSGTPGRGYEILGTQFLEPGKKADLKEVSQKESKICLHFGTPSPVCRIFRDLTSHFRDSSLGVKLLARDLFLSRTSGRGQT